MSELLLLVGTNELFTVALHGTVSVPTCHLESEGFRKGPSGPRISDRSQSWGSWPHLVPSASRGVSSSEFAVLPRFDHASPLRVLAVICAISGSATM